MAWWDPVSKDTDHTDGKVASKIIELIEQKKDEPFFLAAGFFNPHCPYVAPKKYFDLYPLDQITMQDLEKRSVTWRMFLPLLSEGSWPTGPIILPT